MTTLPKFLLARFAEEREEYERDDSGMLSALLIQDRLLAEVEAKRRIVKRYQTSYCVRGGVALDVVGWVDEQYGYAQGLSDAMLDLAQPYSEHADFDPSWRR